MMRELTNSKSSCQLRTSTRRLASSPSFERVERGNLDRSLPSVAKCGWKKEHHGAGPNVKYHGDTSEDCPCPASSRPRRGSRDARSSVEVMELRYGTPGPGTRRPRVRQTAQPVRAEDPSGQVRSGECEAVTLAEVAAKWRTK